MREVESRRFQLDRGQFPVEVFGSNGQSSQGNYRLLWKSPSEWQEQIIFPGYKRTRFGGEGKYWQERSINYELPQIHQLDQALDFNPRLRSSVAKVSAKLKTEKNNQASIVCAHLKENYDEEDFCFDPAEGTLVLEKLPHGTGGGEENIRAREYADFVKFGDKLFPRSIRVVGQKAQLVTFAVGKLVPLSQTESIDFIAPAGAEEWLTCAQPERPKLLNQTPPDYPTQAKINHEQGRVVFYALIGTDGSVHNLKLIESVSPLLDSSATQAVSKWQYDPRKCNGVPTITETFIDVIYSLN